MKQRILVIIGALLIIAAGIWKVGLSPRWANRYQDQWELEVETIGQTGYPDETGNYPEGTTLEDDPINLTLRRVTAEADGAPAGQMNINDHFESRDTVTNEVTWEYTGTAVVDAATGRHVGGDFDGDYYFLPRNVDPNTTYVISNSSYRSIEMVFQREEEIGGINTYLYAYYGDLDNTAGNAAFVDLEPNQVVTCFDFALEYWVEPVTGEIVKFREWCEGDWIVDSDTGERIATISRWGGETSGADIIRRVTDVQNLKRSYLWVTLYTPLLFGALGIALMVIGFVSSRRGTQPQAA